MFYLVEAKGESRWWQWLPSKPVGKVGQDVLSDIGFSELLFIILIGLILFGPQKLPELGRAAGKTIREFKMTVNGLIDQEPIQKAKDRGHQIEPEQETKRD
jgi:sec-independent protein translocase protein TatA